MKIIKLNSDYWDFYLAVYPDINQKDFAKILEKHKENMEDYTIDTFVNYLNEQGFRALIIVPDFEIYF